MSDTEVTLQEKKDAVAAMTEDTLKVYERVRLVYNESNVGQLTSDRQIGKDLEEVASDPARYADGYTLMLTALNMTEGKARLYRARARRISDEMFDMLTTRSDAAGLSVTELHLDEIIKGRDASEQQRILDHFLSTSCSGRDLRDFANKVAGVDTSKSPEQESEVKKLTSLVSSLDRIRETAHMTEVDPGFMRPKASRQTSPKYRDLLERIVDEGGKSKEAIEMIISSAQASLDEMDREDRGTDDQSSSQDVTYNDDGDELVPIHSPAEKRKTKGSKATKKPAKKAGTRGPAKAAATAARSGHRRVVSRKARRKS